MREIRTTKKLIITVAPTGGFHGKENVPNLPTSPAEIAQATYDCYNAGAAIVHIHARDQDGNPTNDLSILGDIQARIRAKCNVVLQNSTGIGVAPSMSPRDKMKPIETNPEMASLNMGTTVATWKGQEVASIRTRSDLEWAAAEMLKRGIKPEMEIYNPSMMGAVEHLIAKDLLKKPYYFSFVMHMHRVNQAAVPYTPENLMHYLNLLPPDSLFTVVGVGEAQLPLTTLSILLGGHIRVGMEDNIYYKHGERVESNAQLVSRAVRIARELGCEIASPDEARQILNLPSR